LILQIIQQNPGITFTELANHDSIRLSYNKKEVSAEIEQLKNQSKVYLVKPNRGSRHLYAWKADFICARCEGTLPDKRPSEDNPNLCAKCAQYKNMTLPDAEINQLMRDWSVLPLMSSLTPDPRGYYGVSR